MRIWTDGAELKSNVQTGNPGGVAMDTGTVRTGEYSYRLDNNGGWWHIGYFSECDLYVQFAIRFNHSDGNSWFHRLYNASTYVSQIDFIYRTLVFYCNGVQKATYFPRKPTERFILVEYHQYIHPTNGIYEVKVDGDLIFSDNGLNSGVGPATYLWFGSNWNNRGYYVDDIAINSGSGAYNNSWCGDSRSYIVVPDGAGDVTQLTPSAGANYECVDELPPNTSDYTSGSSIGKYDLYNVGSVSSWLPSSYGIHAIHPIPYAYGISNDYIKIGIKTSGSEAWSAPIEMKGSWDAWTPIGFEAEPDGTLFTPATLDLIQVGAMSSGSV